MTLQCILASCLAFGIGRQLPPTLEAIFPKHTPPALYTPLSLPAPAYSLLRSEAFRSRGLPLEVMAIIDTEEFTLQLIRVEFLGVEEYPASSDGGLGKVSIFDSLTRHFYCYSVTRLASFPVTVGRNPGQKSEVGDLRTPKGIYRVSHIQDSRQWKFIDKDKKVFGYGRWFFRLHPLPQSPIRTRHWEGIGLHGADDDAAVGNPGRNSHGCCRLRARDLARLRTLLAVGGIVILF